MLVAHTCIHRAQWEAKKREENKVKRVFSFIQQDFRCYSRLVNDGSSFVVNEGPPKK